MNSSRTLLPIRQPDGWNPGFGAAAGPVGPATRELRGSTTFLCGHCLTPMFTDHRDQDFRAIPPSQCYRCMEWSTGIRTAR
jgi:hypothetical protein